MKVDKIRGAEDINNFGIFCKFIGSFFYCIATGYAMSLENPIIGGIMPKFYFACSFLVGFLIMVYACLYPKSSEIDA